MLSTCTLQIRCGNAEIPRKVGKTTRPMPLFWNSLPVDLFARYHSDINQIGESSQHIGSLIMDIDASSTGVSSGTRIQNSFPLNRSTIIVESLNHSHKPSYPPGLDLPRRTWVLHRSLVILRAFVCLRLTVDPRGRGPPYSNHIILTDLVKIEYVKP